MADFIVDPIIEKLIEIGSEYLKDQFRWQTGMKEELKRLQDKLPKIQAIVHYASGQYLIEVENKALNKWLWQLRDAIEEADDVLDEFEYLKLKEEREKTKLKKTKKLRKMRFIMRSIKQRLFKLVKRAFKMDSTLKRLEKAVIKLDEVFSADEVTTLHRLVKEAKKEHNVQELELYRGRETGPLPNKYDQQIGRDWEKEYVINWLRKTSNEDQATTHNSNISLLSVEGQGGMGKTTLLQHAYNHELMKEFDLKMWVCVSNNFDEKKVIEDMLEYATKEKRSFGALGPAQETLKSTVDGKKFLLVLDDIWEEESKEQSKNKWEKVLAPLYSGKLGSKILMTTRMKSATSMLSEVINQKNETMILEGLKDEQCLQLLNKYAFANVENVNLHQNLRPITEKMVKKLSGSPLAARVIGGVLNSHLDERHWINVSNYDIGGQNDIFFVLKLSYIFLPKVLRNCLSFCCTFPQDYEYDKDDLVRMWISLGFIQPSNYEGETMKDVGERYFNNLVRKSLLDKFGDFYGTCYKLHDLIHEMLRVVSAQQCFSIVDEIVGDEELLLRNSETIRHLYVHTRNLDVLKKVEKFKNLRSFILHYFGNDEDLLVVLANIFKTSRSIRLMHIKNLILKQMSVKIGHLIHLRYLKIDEYFNQLPVSLSNLYHLKFMIFKHYFRFPDVLNFAGIYEIGKLNSLQDLHGFYVQNKSGYRLEELELMNELRVLKIIFLENLNDAKDAYKAKLQDKRNLIDLSLKWSFDSRNFVDGLNENGIDNLQPHSSLKKLEIKHYMGIRPAKWMNDLHLISNLEYIKLNDCWNLQSLPPFWQLPFLKHLYLFNMKEVKGVDYTFHGIDKVHVFPSLQVLHIENLKALENLFVATAASAYECLFPCLNELSLQHCPNLKELPSLPPKLEKLKICDVGWKGSTWLQGITNYCSFLIKDCPNLFSLEGHQEMETTDKCQLILNELIINDPSMLLMVPLTSVTSIRKLGIHYNNEVISFPIEAEQWFLQVSSSLCELSFTSLKSLQTLPSSLEGLSSLKILHVEDGPLLQLLPNMGASLEKLELAKLESLQSYPSSLESLSSLKILHVEDVPLLQLLPNLPASLEQLKLKSFKSLRSFLPSLENISSLKILHVEEVPLLQLLPNILASLEELVLVELESLQNLPSSFESLSSLKILHVEDVPLLQLLPNMPASVKKLKLVKLESLQSLPSSLESLSSLEDLDVEDVPLLQLLPNMPASVKRLNLVKLESLQSLPSSLESLSSLEDLFVRDVLLLQLLPNMPISLKELKLEGLKSLQSYPSSLESLSSLKILHVEDIPLLQLLPNMPASVKKLKLVKLESLQSLPSSLESLSSLEVLIVRDVPLLQLLPNMPTSLKSLQLESLESLQCLPSSLSFFSLNCLCLRSIPLLQKLPDLTPYVFQLIIIDCHPELKKRYQMYTGSEWHKIAHIGIVHIQ